MREGGLNMSYIIKGYIEKIMERAWDNMGMKIAVKKKKGKVIDSSYAIKAFSYDDWVKLKDELKDEV